MGSDGVNAKKVLGQHFSPFSLPFGFLRGVGGEQPMLCVTAACLPGVRTGARAGERGESCTWDGDK